MTAPTTTLSDLPSRQRQLFSSSSSSCCSTPFVALKPWSARVNVRSRSRQRPIFGTVSFSLPTAKQPERGSSSSSSSSSSGSSVKIPKWSRRAIKSFAMAELEARKLKYATTGTEALLMGLLIEGTSTASKFLRANGIILTKVREEAVKITPKGDMYYFSPEHPPLTDDAQRALDWALEQKLKSADDGEITTGHLLLGIWTEVESPGHKILGSLGFDNGKAEELRALTLGAKNDD